MAATYMTPGVYIESTGPINSNHSEDNLPKTLENINVILDQSKVNAAICASNVIAAVNAVVRVASDIGSIFSIVSAADSGTEMYTEVDALKVETDATASLGTDVSQQVIALSLATSSIAVTNISNADDVKPALSECIVKFINLLAATDALKDKWNSSHDLLNKLSAVVTQEKALNPLISDDLIARISSTVKYADQVIDLLNAAELTIKTAQDSCFQLTMMLA